MHCSWSRNATALPPGDVHVHPHMYEFVTKVHFCTIHCFNFVLIGCYYCHAALFAATATAKEGFLKETNSINKNFRLNCCNVLKRWLFFGECRFKKVNPCSGL